MALGGHKLFIMSWVEDSIRALLLCSRSNLSVIQEHCDDLCGQKVRSKFKVKKSFILSCLLEDSWKADRKCFCLLTRIRPIFCLQHTPNAFNSLPWQECNVHACRRSHLWVFYNRRRDALSAVNQVHVFMRVNCHRRRRPFFFLVVVVHAARSCSCASRNYGSNYTETRDVKLSQTCLKPCRCCAFLASLQNSRKSSVNELRGCNWANKQNGMTKNEKKNVASNKLNIINVNTPP